MILSTGGVAYVDCVQAEISSGASRYNLIQNGDFHTNTYWTESAGRTAVSASAAPQLDTTVYKMTGSPDTLQSVCQIIGVKGNAYDAYVLAGWAKGTSVPLNSGPRQFAMCLTFYNTDGTTTTTRIDFNAAYDAANDWQYTAGWSASKK